MVLQTTLLICILEEMVVHLLSLSCVGFSVGCGSALRVCCQLLVSSLLTGCGGVAVLLGTLLHTLPSLHAGVYAASYPPLDNDCFL